MYFLWESPTGNGRVNTYDVPQTQCVHMYFIYLYLYGSLLGHCLVLSFKLYIDIHVIHWTLKNKDDTILEQTISVPAKLLLH